MSLGVLVDELLILVVAHFDRAQEVAHLGQACRRLHHFVETEGWKIFARARFPALTLTTTATVGWAALSESLTWQSRCWDRRGLAFMRLPLARFQAYQASHRASRPFHAVVDAHLRLDSGQELVAWGAGGDVVARSRQTASRSGSSKADWARFDGTSAGYQAGPDDVVSLKIVEAPFAGADGLGLVAGRASGNISMLSILPGGNMKAVATFAPLPRDEDRPARGQQGKLYSLDVSARNRLLVASTAYDVVLYALPQEKAAEMLPSASLDMDNRHFQADFRPHCAKWMGDGDLLAVATAHPARAISFTRATPSGFSALMPAAKNADLEARFPSGGSRHVYAHSIQPLDKPSSTGGIGSLLLSAWRDGTIRLQDVRTSSDYDMVYQDNINTLARYGSLLPRGESFVAAGLEDATIKIFDFRWTKHYYHTESLACGHEEPFPRAYQPFLPRRDARQGGDYPCAYYGEGLRAPCHWHKLSRRLYFRPNCSFYLTKSLTYPGASSPNVWSLAKSADVAPNFYIGITGGVVEASLRSATDGSVDPAVASVDPHFGFTNKPYPGKGLLPRSGSQVEFLDAPLLETGDGLAAPDNHRNIRLPALRQLDYTWTKDLWLPRNRLDQAYQMEID